jgi:hypothetical protein
MEILNTLVTLSFKAFGDKVAALPGRYARALRMAAEKLEPAIQYNPSLPSRILKTDADVDKWLEDVAKRLKQLLKNGPIRM